MRSIPESELCEELRSLAWKLYRHPNTEDMTNFGAYSPQTYQNRFGSWQAALDTAGIADLTAPALSDEELFQALHEVVAAMESTAPPTQRDVATHSEYSPLLYIDRFDSWIGALSTAGFETHMRTNSDQVTVTDATLLEALKQTATVIQHTPTADEMDNYGDYHGHIYEDRFGSWEETIAEAGLAPPETSRNTQYSEATLLEHLRDLATDLDRTPTVRDMNAADGPFALTYQHRFGSWNEALEAAGLEPNVATSHRISTDQLLADLQALADSLGTTPTQRQVRNQGSYSPKTYVRRFGSWNEAVRAAGLTPNLTSSPDRR